MGIETVSDNSLGSSEGGAGGALSARATAAIRFRVVGPAAMLSHAEMARLFQRACARADIPVRYSEGFNPHPRLSLPLPRPVGVESDDELLVARLCGASMTGSPSGPAGVQAAMMRALAGQLPAGIEVFDVTLAASNASFQPRSAEYILPLRVHEHPDLTARLADEIARVMDSEHCMVQRASADRRTVRSIDVRPFLLSIRLQGDKLVVQHTMGDAGSIRVDEILQLFGLRTDDVEGPICRTHVVWETSRLQNTPEQPRAKGEAEDIEDGTRDVD
ncbi:MAG: TIGR03936 family radical SAM-associated protein [Phycisphaerae bacterium]|nr:TIGR03936 family radical SAM-associated protein [Phycisphaerae bacterium]